MRYKTMKAAYIIQILIIAIGGVIGCSSRSFSHKKFNDQGRLIDHIKGNSNQGILNSDIDNIHVKVTSSCGGVTKEIHIGKIEQSPDAEAVKAISEGVISGLGNVLIRTP